MSTTTPLLLSNTILARQCYSFHMKYWLFILTIFSLGSLAAEPNLSTYQNNQVQQALGEVYFTSNKTILKYEDIVSTPSGDYKLEFVGHPYEGGTYRQANYYYRITKNNGELVYENGKSHEKRHFNEGVKKEGKLMPLQFYTLDIQGKRVGWLFGWNKYENAEYYQDIDFSFARVLIPTGETLYTASGDGFKFKEVADLLDKQDNQLVVTEGYTQDTFDAKPTYGYHYIPIQHLIALEEGSVTVSTGVIDISDRLIENDPYYAYAIALNTDKYDDIKRISDRFKDKLELASNHCPQFELTVAEACPECTSEGLFRPAAYLGVHIDRWGEGGWEAFEKARDRVDDIETCLTEVLTEDEFYHLFYRTGLFPSQRVIDDYLENQYRYMEEFYYDYKYQKE